MSSKTPRIIGEPFPCEQCGNHVVRTGATQMFCVECSEARAAARKRKYDRENPYSKIAKRRYQDGTKSVRIAQGERISGCEQWGLDRVFPDESGMAWVRKVSIPYTQAFSKNYIFGRGDEGHVIRRQQQAAARGRLAEAIREATADVGVVQNKLWIAVVVQKPDHKSDAVNFVDHVCDALPDATGLDDRWYCIRQIDWQIIKTNPMLMVGLGQDSTEPVQSCCYCGRLLPFGMFWRQKHNKNGIGRECKDCTRAPGRTA